MGFYEMDDAHIKSSKNSSQALDSLTVPPGEVDFTHFFELLRRHRWLVLLLTSALTIAAYLYVSTITPVYRSTATILVEPQRANVVSIEEIYDIDDSQSEYYETQIQLLKSRELARNTIEALNLWDHKELHGLVEENSGHNELDNSDPSITENNIFQEYLAKAQTKANRAIAHVRTTISKIRPTEASDSAVTQATTSDSTSNEITRRDYELRAIRNFTNRLIVGSVRKTKLIKINYDSTDPELAAKIANEIVEQYVASHLATRSEVTASASQWLSRRLTELKSKLVDSEKRLRTFKKENGLVDVDGRVGRLNEQELLALTKELSETRSKYSSTSSLHSELKSLGNSPELLGGISAFQSDPIIRLIQIEQGKAQRTLDELRNRYGEKHPRVIDAMSQLETLNQEQASNVARLVNSVGKDLQLLATRITDIESKLEFGKKEIQEIGSKKFELDVLEREANTNQKLYDIFFSRFTEAGSANGLEQPNARLVEAAVPAPGPIKPRKSLITAMVGAGAFVFSILLLLILDRLDNTIKGSRDVERKLGLKLLGVLPTVKLPIFSNDKTAPLHPIGNADKAGTFAEAVNATRTAISIDEKSANYNIILVTSSVPNEGKSTTSINLAYSFGQQEKILIIDGDMRRPSIARTIGLTSNSPGLSDLIKGSTTPSNCIRRGVLNNTIDILPAGSIPDHPLELLTDVRLELLLSKLSQYYDRIIIDSAPIHAVSDALVFSKFSDAVLYVIKSHDTMIPIIKRGLDRLTQVNAPIIGAIVTQADMKKLSSYGGDIHYGGYIDHYGYSEKQIIREKHAHNPDLFDDLNSEERDDFSNFVHLGTPRTRTIGEKFRSSRLSQNDSNRRAPLEAVE